MKNRCLAVALCLFLCGTVLAQTVAPFKAGDRVTFVGNSITDGGHYHSFIWLYYMTRMPYDQMWMANCGIGGDTSADIFDRLDGDVFAKNPNVITLTFGMNDSGYDAENPESFVKEKMDFAGDYFKRIEERLKGLVDTRIVMIGTSPYDQTSTMNDNILKRKNNTIEQMIGLQRTAAEKNHWEFLDFNAPMVAINQAQQKTNPAFSICGNDRIHPDNDGHMVMAYLFLKAQGFVGSKVSDMAVDKATGKVALSENCTLSNVKTEKKSLSFDYLANALPYPLDTLSRGWGFKRSQADFLKLIPEFMEEMNTERLKVTSLKGKWQLIIDNEPIAVFTGEELAKGVNLAEYVNTPQYRQSLAIMMLNEERWDIERRFRDYAWLQYGFFQGKGLLDANNQKAIAVFEEGAKHNGWVAGRRDLYGKMIHQDVRDAYQAEMDLLVSKIYEINKPKTRKITLIQLNK